MDLSELSLDDLFWSATPDQLKRGYHPVDNGFICLVCGAQFSQGEVYPHGDKWFTAERMASVHVQDVHGSMFYYLLGLNKKITGLTDHQRTLLRLFFECDSDAEIVKSLGGGSASTIRAHRFTLREKEKQAKVFLAIMELLGEKQERKPSASFIGIHKTATTIDERYAVTLEENEEILKKYFPEGASGRLKEFPKKEKRKIAILRHIMARFEARRTYTEKEVNDVLKTVYEQDYVTLRRYLIEYGFMDRKEDGSSYWVKQ